MTISPVRVAVATLATAFLCGSTLATTSLRAWAATTYGVNLVVNGDAEADKGAPSSSPIVKPSGWTTTGEFDVMQYGASGGFPDKTSPGPADRGKNLFEGGNVAKSTATQSISLAGAASDIAAGSVHYTLSAYLGGFANQEDSATVSVSFTDASGATVGSGARLPAVTQAQRKGVTGLLARGASGVVPKGAANAVVTIVVTRSTGTYNDGSVDDVSLVLSKS